MKKGEGEEEMKERVKEGIKKGKSKGGNKERRGGGGTGERRK